MKLALVRIALFGMIPLGAFLLHRTIRSVRKSFGGKTLAEIPFLQKTGTFEIAQPGVYALWHQGQAFRKLPVDRFRPAITREDTGERIALTPSLLRPQVRKRGRFSMELFRFRAEPGAYGIELAEGSSVSAVEALIARAVPAREADLREYVLQVRESQPVVHLLIGIPLLVVSGCLMIGGLVLGILAGQIFPGP